MLDHRIKVLVADARPAFREGLRHFVEIDGVCQVAAEAEDAAAVFLAAQKHEHDVMLLSAMIPGCNSFELISAYKTQHINSKVVVHHINEDVNLLHGLHRSGADGFIGLSASSDEYRAAIKTVVANGNFFSDNLTDAMFKIGESAPDSSNIFGLTSRELEILSLLANGLCNKEIANRFDLSVRTVETHRLNIRRKTTSNTLSDLVRVARSLGIVHMGEIGLNGSIQPSPMG